jgi:acetyl esterase/lipase
MRQIMTVGVLLLLACCGGETSDEVGTSAATTTTTTAVTPSAAVTPPPSTTLVTELVTETAGGQATELTEGLRYHLGGEQFTIKSGEVDVISPASGDAYPTVVVLHGNPLYADKRWHRLDAQLIAEQGRVVFLPTWGHYESAAVQDIGAEGAWELNVREAECAVAFARGHTAEFGGDPDNITLYGFSAGASPVLMAGLSEVDPLEACSSAGPAGAVQALVPIDADWVMGGGWDTSLRANPDAFYSITPWRLLDGSQDIPIHVVVAEITGSYTRSVEPDPATSWLSYRHIDIDLVADLDDRGYLADGEFSLMESSEYAIEILHEAGYDATLVVMPGASHDSWGTEGRAAVVETVVSAGQR